MSKISFEEAELGIIAMFEQESKEETISYIEEAEEFIDEEDTEILDLMKSATEKLKQLPEEEFRDFDYAKYLFEEDEDES